MPSLNEIILNYVEQASTYHQLHSAQLQTARNDQSPTRFYNAFSASAFHKLYYVYLRLARNAETGGLVESEAEIETRLNDLEQSMRNAAAGLGGATLNEAVEAFQTEIQRVFGMTIIDNQFTPSGQYNPVIALTRYRKGVEDVAKWLKSIYCHNQANCNLNRYQVFRDVIGFYSLVRTQAPASVIPDALYQINQSLWGVPRGLTKDHVTYEIFGSSKYWDQGGGSFAANTLTQVQMCAQFPTHCTNNEPNSFDYNVLSYINSMEAGNLTHELAHIFINSGGFGSFIGSPIYQNNPIYPNNPVVAEMSDILDNQGIFRYNTTSVANEIAANFIGALAVDSNPNTETPFHSNNAHNDGVPVLDPYEANLDTTANTSFRGLLHKTLVINVLRNTPPEVIAMRINATNPVSFAGAVLVQVNDMRSSPTNLTDDNILPIPVRINSSIKLLGRTLATQTPQWFYVAVGRPDNTADVRWYDYGWLLATSISTAGNTTNLPEFAFNGVNPFDLIETP